VKLIALHGYSMNGAVMRRQLGFVQQALPSLEILAPDAPHRCTPEAVDRLHAIWDAPRQAPPHAMWWDASDDGREYRGWEATRDLLRGLLDTSISTSSSVGLIGFSQGAILATALAALAVHGEMPPIELVILIAGRTPRADVLHPFLKQPLAVPSLHIWGEADTLVGDSSRALLDTFLPDQRQVVTWAGKHSIPKTGPAAAAIVDFLARRAVGAAAAVAR
jgi:predicted esterase